MYFCQAAWYIAAAHIICIRTQDPASHRVSSLARRVCVPKVLLQSSFSFLEYVFTVIRKVCNGPWLLLWSRGRRRGPAPLAVTGPYCDPVCSQSAPCKLNVFFTHKMSLIILPGAAAALVACVPSLPASYDVRKPWVEWVASERKDAY